MKEIEQNLIEIMKYEVLGATAGEKKPEIGVTRELFNLARHHEVAQLVADYLGCKKAPQGSGSQASSGMQAGSVPQANVAAGADAGRADAEAAGTATDAEKKFRAEIAELYNAELYRALTFKTDLSRISMILEDAGIDYIPLKGAIIRDLYPKSWMRSSTDIDILVRPADIDRAASVITAQPGYMLVNQSGHHLLIESKTGWIIELHYDLSPNAHDAKGLLDKAWDYAAPAGKTLAPTGKSTTPPTRRYNFTDEFFELYFYYHLSHHARKHGALGLRQMLDVFMLAAGNKDSAGNSQAKGKQDSAGNSQAKGKQDSAGNSQAKGKLLEKAGLARFAEVTSTVATVWFGGLTAKQGAKALGISMEEFGEVEAFALNGGMAGTKESKMTMRRVNSEGKRENSRSSYAASRIVLSTDDLAAMHKEVRENPKLAPVYQVKRWARFFRPGRAANAKKEIELASSIGDNEIDRAKRVLRNLGL